MGQASGANIHESGLAQHGSEASSVSPGSIIPGETWYGGGIAQWEDYKGDPGRWTGADGFHQLCGGQGYLCGHPQGDGKNWKVLSFSLILYGGSLAIRKKNALDHLKTTNTVEQATQSFVEKYERAGIPALANRIKYAKETLDAFGGLVPDNVAPAAPAAVPASL
jgi:hypothetical protein